MKYLSMFYTFKFTGGSRGPQDLANKAVEMQVRNILAEANHWFINGNYQTALDLYLHAWALLVESLWGWFPATPDREFESMVLKEDLSEYLLEKSADSLSYIGIGGSSDLRSSLASPAPEQVKAFAKRKGVSPPGDSMQKLERGLKYLDAGNIDSAEKALSQALGEVQGVRGMTRVAARIKSALAVVDVAKGSLTKAIEGLKIVQSDYRGILRKDQELAACLDHNLGIAHVLLNQTREARVHFNKAVRSLPIRLNWDMDGSQRTADMPVLLSDGSTWRSINLPPILTDKTDITVWYGSKPVNIRFDGTAARQQIRSELLEKRMQAQTLKELETRLEEPIQFISYLSVVGGFILPMCIGDCYAEMGIPAKALEFYRKARDYKYLNLNIERPALWVKAALVYLRSGKNNYANGNIEDALFCFEQIVHRFGGSYHFIGELYEGAFADLKSEHGDFLNTGTALGDGPVDYDRRSLLLEALFYHRQIDAGLNFHGQRGFALTIHSWLFLQNAARYFANQARQAERSYIMFKNSAEEDRMTRMSLEHSSQILKKAVKVEEQRYESAKSQKKTADESLVLADLRQQSAIDQKDMHNTIQDAILPIESLQAALMGGGHGVLLSSLSTSSGQLTKAYEQAEMQRHIDELAQAREIFLQQQAAALFAEEAASEQKELAELKAEKADAYLEAYDEQEFDEELWDNLAKAQKEMCENYLQMATDTALMMERAFETEYDVVVGRIQSEYHRDETGDLLAADDLLYDIDQFTLDRLMHTEKQVPMKKIISLAESFPFAFTSQFRKTGRIDFETSLFDFDRDHPGLHIRKLRGAEVIVRGLVGPRGINGTLRNTGISRYRDRNGAVSIRVQRPEVLPLSRFDLRADGFVFTQEESLLRVFENSGIACGWTLDFPPGSNDLDLASIYDIEVVFYYDGYFSGSVESRVRAELEARAWYEHMITISLGASFVDEFFDLQHTGEFAFDLSAALIPRNHTDARIKSLYLFVQTDDDVSNEALTLSVTAPGAGQVFATVTDEKGMVKTSAGEASPLNALVGTPVEGLWRIALPEAPNQGAFSSGFTWEKVQDIFFAAEYNFTPAFPPIVTDDFAVDSRSAFDIIDDSTVSTQSEWVHAPGRIVQKQAVSVGGEPSNIAGTYLVRKTSDQYPARKNFFMQSHLRSFDVDAIGVVFNYMDQDNFHVFCMDRRRKYRLLARKEAGAFEEILKTTALPAFETGQKYRVSIAVVNGSIAIGLDGNIIMTTHDDPFKAAGRVGFYCRGNSKANFLDLSFRAL